MNLLKTLFNDKKISDAEINVRLRGLYKIYEESGGKKLLDMQATEDKEVSFEAMKIIISQKLGLF
jgi:hypothetical protein